MLGCKAVDTPMKANVKLLPDQREILDDPDPDPDRYRQLVGKLNYPIVIRPDIAFVVSVVSHFLSAPRITHWKVVVRILKYLKKGS